MDELLRSTLMVAAGIFVLFFVIPMFVAVVVKTGVYAYFKGKKRFEKEQEPWKGRKNGT